MAAKTRRRRRSRAQWRLLIERAERSPLSSAAFRQAEGISTASFYAWRKRIANATPHPAGVSDCAAAPLGSPTGMTVPRTAEAAPFLDLGALADVRPEAAHWDLELAFGAGVVLRLRRI